MKRSLIINIFCAFALFFLLLIGENALHSQKTIQQDNVTSALTFDLVSQQQLKAITVVKEINLTETIVTRPFIGAATVLQAFKWWRHVQNNHSLFKQNRFVPDKRKTISNLIFPYHFFL